MLRIVISLSLSPVDVGDDDGWHDGCSDGCDDGWHDGCRDGFSDGCDDG